MHVDGLGIKPYCLLLRNVEQQLVIFNEYINSKKSLVIIDSLEIGLQFETRERFNIGEI